MTIQDYSREFERQLKLRNNANSTIDTYIGIMRQFLLFYKKDPRAITVRMIEDYLLTLKSTAYKKQTIYTLQNFYANVLGMNDYLSSIPIPKKEKFIPEILNVNEVHNLIQSISNLKQRAVIQLIYSCALRIGEVVNIRVKDIDGQRMQLAIRQAKGAKDRLVPIPEDTLNLIREYYKQYRPKEYLFEGQCSPQYDVRSIQQVFYRAKDKAGIRKKVSVHSLRHSRATHLVDNGVDMSMIQKFLGHSQIKTTVDFYLHTSIVSMQNIFARVDSSMQQSIYKNSISDHGQTNKVAIA